MAARRAGAGSRRPPWLGGGRAAMRAYLSSCGWGAALVVAVLCWQCCGIGAAIAQAPVVDECCLQLCFGDDWHAIVDLGLLRELAACKTLGMPRQAKQKRPKKDRSGAQSSTTLAHRYRAASGCPSSLGHTYFSRPLRLHTAHLLTLPILLSGGSHAAADEQTCLHSTPSACA